jgi:hypothetical protein
VTRKIKSTAELLQLFLSKGRDLFKIDLVIDRTAIMERTLSLLNSMETIKAGENICFGSDHFLEVF